MPSCCLQVSANLFLKKVSKVRKEDIVFASYFHNLKYQNTWVALRTKASIASDSWEHSYPTTRSLWNRSIRPTVFSHAHLLFFPSGITPVRLWGVLPFHSLLFAQSLCFKWHLALISLTSSLSPLPFSFDCYSRKNKDLQSLPFPLRAFSL